MTRTIRLLDQNNPDESVLVAASEVVAQGGIIVYPTETLYGIGADATDPAAVRKVYAVKKRTDDKPVLVIVHSEEMLRRVVSRIPASAERLMKAFWPGPLTIVFLASEIIPQEITQSAGTVGVRIPSNIFCLKLVERCDRPLTSTSANISGEPVHRTIEQIQAALHEGVDLYIDAGPLPESKPSTVVSVVHDPPKLLREGVIDIARLQEVLPNIQR
jgi:L-threonylcarbamoyladenylate synthase